MNVTSEAVEARPSRNPCGIAGRRSLALTDIVQDLFCADWALLLRYTDNNQTPELLQVSGIDDDEIESITDDLADRAIGDVLAGRSRRTTDLMQSVRPAAVADGRMLRLWVRPSPAILLVLAIARRPDAMPFCHEEEGKFTAQQPLLLELLRLWWHRHSERQHVQALSRALDMSEIGIMLFNAGLNLIHANQQASHLLSASSGLRKVGATIGASNLDDSIKLQTALRHALGHQPGTRARPLEVPILSIRRRDRRPLVASLVPIGNPSSQPGDPAVILFVLDPEQEVLALLEATCRLFGLTASESRLTCHLIAGQTLTEAAKAMRISPDTARAYLKQVFAKTGTHRQADLMRLMLTSVIRTPATVKVSAIL